jgi:hypothetical protein
LLAWSANFIVGTSLARALKTAALQHIKQVLAMFNLPHKFSMLGNPLAGIVKHVIYSSGVQGVYCIPEAVQNEITDAMETTCSQPNNTLSISVACSLWSN